MNDVTKVVVGNLLSDSVPFASSMSVEDPDNPFAFVHDGPGKMAARFLTDPPGNPTIDIELNLVAIDDASIYTAVVGTVEVSTDQDHGRGITSGGNSLKVLGSGAQADSVEYTVRSGYRYWIEGWAFGGAAALAAKISLYNPNTKRWWNGSAWVDTIAYLASSSTAAWVGIGAGAGVEVTIESPAVTMGPTTTIQVQLWRVTNPSADAVYFDDILLYAGVNFMGVFGGHNISPWIPVTWSARDSQGTEINLETFTKAPNQFFVSTASVIFAPEHIFTLVIGGGVPPKEFFLGDLLVGQAQELPVGPSTDAPIDVTYEEKGQARQETPAGARYVANRGPYPPRRLSLKYRFGSAEAEASFRAVMVDQVRGGAQPVVFIPVPDQMPELAIYGDVQTPIAFGRAPLSTHQSDGEFDYYSETNIVVEEGAGYEED